MKIDAAKLLELATAFNSYLALANALTPLAQRIRDWITDAINSEEVTEEEREELKAVRAELEKKWAEMAPVIPVPDQGPEGPAAED